MKHHSKKASIAKIAIFGIFAGAAFTFALMLLWNWLMPVIFGLTAITFWQALGLFVLSKIIFGKGSKPNWHNKEKSNIHKEQFMKLYAKHVKTNSDKLKDTTPKNEE